MEKEKLKRLIDVSAGRVPADTVIKNCKIVDVYNATIIEGDIAIYDDLIAGIGEYNGTKEWDAQGKYASPGLIDSHVHIESSYVSPEEFGRMVIPHGTTTIIADAHEIANVHGITGLEYMIDAGKKTKLAIKWMLPSCVPATPFEHAGAVIDAKAMNAPLSSGNFLGLGEFMDFPGVIHADDAVVDKLIAAKNHGIPIDGHSPAIVKNDLNAYVAAGIHTDHECSAKEEMLSKIARGMYALMREGSACHDLRKLLKGVTSANSRRCLLCTDDCQPKTIMELGHLENHLRICVEEGLSGITAIQMASLNAAECYGLADRGAIAPGLRADIVLFDDLQQFHTQQVWIAGKLTAENGAYLPSFERHSISSVQGALHIGDFSKEKLALTIHAEKAHAIEILSGGVVTRKKIVDVHRNEQDEFVYQPEQDLVKIVVIERHHDTGYASAGLLSGYGIKHGAIAISIAHDSHNVITTGVNDEDMAFAVEQLALQEGGVILVKDGKILESMPLPIAGLMSNQSGEWVDRKLQAIHEAAHRVLGVNRDVEPIMTLCFMSLPVIPELKLTDSGLFDVTQFKFIPIEAD
nr:adenine deaminase [Scatolibacter rhodanostii]